MKVYRIIVAVLLCLATGFFAYEAFVTKELAGGELVKAGLVLVGLLGALIAPKKNKSVASKKSLYQKAYGEFLRNAFAHDPKGAKKLYAAIADYNHDQPGAALDKLRALRQDCHSSDDIYAVTVFSALCYDDAGLRKEAAEEYKKALALRPSSALASNLGLCCDRMGDAEAAIAAYERAIALDGKNDRAYNNLSALYFRQEDYETALHFAQTALQYNDRMPQALSTCALCCGLLGRQEEYESYYRRAVSAGYSGDKIKNALRALENPE